VVEDNKYPDLGPPEGGLGELKEIKRYPGMGQAHRISWGKDYMAWPIEKRLDYAEKLAASMNHAADVLQQERNKLLVVVANQDAQLKSNANSYVGQGNLMHKELASADAEKQVLYQEIVQLKAQIKNLEFKIVELTRRLAGSK
jgi:hypothetical protein